MTQITIFDRLKALELRDKGMDQAAYSLNAQGWLQSAQAVARHLAAKNGETTIDEVLAVCPRPPNVSVNATGSIFRGKDWKLIGNTQSSKVASRARRVGIWALND